MPLHGARSSKRVSVRSRLLRRAEWLRLPLTCARDALRAAAARLHTRVVLPEPPLAVTCILPMSHRSASVVFMKVNDLMIYLVGTGEYDELMRALHTGSKPPLRLCRLRRNHRKHLPSTICIKTLSRCAQGRPFRPRHAVRVCTVQVSLACARSRGDSRSSVAVHAVAEMLRAIIAVLKDQLGKVSESGCFRDYGRLVLVLDEMIYEVRVDRAHALARWLHCCAS